MEAEGSPHQDRMRRLVTALRSGVKKTHIFLGAVIVLALCVIATLLGACGGPNDAQPVTCGTFWAPDGTWREEDGEVVDGDPCDTDDAWELDGGGHRVKKPQPRPTPAKQPIGGKGKKF